jgi:excinuclease ABC subunit C
VEQFEVAKNHDYIMSDLIELVRKLPQKPGVYQFFNSQEEILYVGKAKNLRKRVTSYFTGSRAQSYKNVALIKKIANIQYILVENESDALLLENNLIKEYQPRYNILLKDDKTYPWLCIKNERFPRIFSTRNYLNDGSEYFGPYTSGLMVKTLMELVRQLFPLRTCKILLLEEHIKKGKYQKCLEFHLGNCKAPCEGLQKESEYTDSINQIREILKGNIHHVLQHLKGLMEQFAQQLKFEQAQIVKNKVLLLDKFKNKSTIVNPRISNVDVFGIIDEPDAAYINFLKVVEGAVVMAQNAQIIKRTDEDVREILVSVIFDLRKRYQSGAPEIIVPILPEIQIKEVKYVVPLRGEKLKLLQLSLRNAVAFKEDVLQSKTIEKARFGLNDKILQQLKDDLRLPKLPVNIECFDNSNIQGTNPVASCVVFKQGKPMKSEYRHFNVKSVIGPDDFTSMAEIILRRYKRLLEEHGELPDLIIVDGGKGQLSAAVKSLKELNVYGKMAIIGIAKRLEEIYVPDDSIALYLNKNSSSLRFIQRIRDEAHRFGIAFHRSKRSHEQVESAFINIPGIGEKSRYKILSVESDLQKLRNFSKVQLIDILGKKAGEALFLYLKKE